MASFDTREAFKNIISEIEGKLGIYVTNTDIDLTNATQGLLHRIFDGLSKKKDNQEELRTLALSIIQKYVEESTNEEKYPELNKRGVEALDSIKLSVKEIFKNADEITLEDEKLKDKLLEVAELKNEPSVNSADIRIETNEEEHKKFTELNEDDALDMVLDEFEKGVFSHETHADFFISHLDNIVVDDDNREKVKKLLELRKENYPSSLISKILEKTASRRNYTGTGDTQGSVANLGLEAAVKGFLNAREKQGIDGAIIGANKAAALYKITGKFDTDAWNHVSHELSNTKWWRFRRKHQLRKAMKDIDPVTHYSFKVNSTSAPLSWYYGIRRGIANTKNRKFDRLSMKLKEVVELQSVYESTTWSKNFGTKLGAKWQLFWRRSPEKLTEAMLRNARGEKLDKCITGWINSKIDELSSAKVRREDERIRNETTLKLFKMIKDVSGKKLEELKKEAKALETRLDSLVPPIKSRRLDSFVKNLEGAVERVQVEYDNNLANDSTYKAFVKAHGEEKAREHFAHKYSKKEVLQQLISDQLGTDGKGKRKQDPKDVYIDVYLKEILGLTEQEIAEFKKVLSLDDTVDDIKKKKLSENAEKRDDKSNEEVSEIKKEAKIVVGSFDENNAKDLSGCSGVKYSVSDNNWAFKKEGADSLTEDEVKALLTEMKTQGVTSLNIGEDVPVEMYEAIVKAAEENGIEIKNKEDVDEKIKEYKKKESLVGEVEEPVVEEPVIEEQVVKPEDNTNPGPATGRDEEAGGKGGKKDDDYKIRIARGDLISEEELRENYNLEGNELRRVLREQAYDTRVVRPSHKKIMDVVNKIPKGSDNFDIKELEGLSENEKGIAKAYLGLRSEIVKKGKEAKWSDSEIDKAISQGDEWIRNSVFADLRGTKQRNDVVYQTAKVSNNYSKAAEVVMKQSRENIH